MAISELPHSKGYRLGPLSNEFTGVDQTAAEASRDSYFSSNPSKLAVYNGNSFLLIRLTYGSSVVAQGRLAGSWFDYTPFLQGIPGEVASLVGVPVGEIPYKKGDGTFAGSNMRVLDNGSILAPPGFGVESGSISFGDVLRVSEVAGFLGITNNLNSRQYTLVDYWTPRTAISSEPTVFHLIESEFDFLSQSIDSTNIPDNPLLFNYTVQNNARTNALTFRTYAAMTNVRIKITQVSNSVTLKYIPNKTVWEEEQGGLSWGLGDNTFDFSDSPVILNAGVQLQFEIRANVVALKGNNTGIPYFTATLQRGVFDDVLTSRVYTPTDIKAKLETLSSPNKLAKLAIQDAVLSVNTRFGDVVLTKADVGLSNVDNTSDMNKPTSTAQQASIDSKMSAHLAAGDPHPQYTTTAEASAAAPIQSVNGATGTVVLTTTNINEGTNLYYTDARVGSYLTTNGYTVKSVASVGTGSSIYQGNTSGTVALRSVIASIPLVATQNTNDITLTAPNVARVYNSSGLVNLPKIWVGTTTCTGGAWTIDYSSAGFINPPVVQATALLNAANVYDRTEASLSGTPTTTSASGYGVRWANLALLGSTARTVPDGTVIHVTVIGN